ncbi:MAG: hypothetical protein K5697_06700, partial [Lachnospiraceae bacterium]|nr:hypothetical protein [Lachnospiraceae bacterium]
DDDWDIQQEGFMGPWKGYFNAVCYYTYTLTVPSDYDGLVMMIQRTSGDCEVPDDYFVEAVKSKREEELNKWSEEEHYLLDPESDGHVPDPANYYFIRLTDEAIAEFNAGN